jgi:CubicO group peptidase (beta-lactamase class C family)
MRTNRIISLFIIGIFLNLSILAQSQHADKAISSSFVYNIKPEDAGISSERLARIDTFMAAFVRDGYAPNVVTFVARHGKVVHNKAYGWKNMENKIPVKTDDIFRIASQSKAIVTVALMTLYEEGKFLLDEPVANYIPEFKNIQVLDSISKKDTGFYAHPAKKVLTIRNLLNHTSGITYENPFYEKAKIPYYNSLDPITIKDVVKKLSSLPLKHEPGGAYTYGMSIDVVGYLIEIISGKPLDKFLKERVFDPIGMKDSYFYLPDNKAERLVTLYFRDQTDGKLIFHRNNAYQTYPVAGARTYFSGGAGLCGTIEDYAKFCQMMLNGGTFNGKQIISRKTVDLMTTNQIGDFEVGDTRDKFGLGFEIYTNNGVAKLPGSAGAYRWGGMYCTDYIIDPIEDIIMLFYTNVLPFDNTAHAKFRTLVYQSLK